MFEKFSPALHSGCSDIRRDVDKIFAVTGDRGTVRGRYIEDIRDGTCRGSDRGGRPECCGCADCARVATRVFARDAERARRLLPSSVDLRAGDPGSDDDLLAAADRVESRPLRSNCHRIE